MKKKRIMKAISLLVVILLGMTLLMTGCKGTEVANDEGKATEVENTEVESTEPEVEEPEATSLTGDFELQLFVGGYGDAWLNAFIEGFQAENPNLNIIANMGPQINEQMRTRWISNDPPDLLYVDGPEHGFEQLAQDGKLVELSDWLETAALPDKTLIKDNIMDGMIVEEFGGVYRTPYILGSWGLWYSSELFERLGLEEPTCWDEFLALQAPLSAEGISLICYTGVYPQYLRCSFLDPTLVTIGGKDLLLGYYNLEPGIFISDDFKAAMNKIQEMVNAGAIMPGTVALNHTQSQMEWLNNKAGFINCGLWLEGEMGDDVPEGFNMKFIPSVAQAAGGKYGTTPYSNGFAVAKNAKNPEAAFAFLEYIYRPENMKKFMQLAGNPVVCGIDTEGVDIPDSLKSVTKWLGNDNVVAVPPPALGLDPDVVKAIEDGLNSMVLGDITADELCEALEKAAEEARKK